MPLMKESSLSFRTDSERKKALKDIAKNTGVTQSQIINDALDAYIAAHRRYVEHVSEGIRQADNGEFVPEKKVNEVFQKWRTTFTKGA